MRGRTIIPLLGMLALIAGCGNGVSPGIAGLTCPEEVFSYTTDNFPPPTSTGAYIFPVRYEDARKSEAQPLNNAEATFYPSGNSGAGVVFCDQQEVACAVDGGRFETQTDGDGLLSWNMTFFPGPLQPGQSSAGVALLKFGNGGNVCEVEWEINVEDPP